MENSLISPPRFAIAKYVPDVRRMEPRNMGIVLWIDGNLHARFVGENDHSGELEYYPSFIRARNKPAYRDWVAYWRLLMQQNSIQLPGVGTVERQSSKFIDAICMKSKDSFLLVDGGFLLDQIANSAAPEALDTLFESLIADKSAHPDPHESEILHDGWRRVIRRAGLADNPNFKPNHTAKGKVGKVEREYKFSAVIENGRVEGVMQKVIASNQQSVNAASFMFEAVQKHYKWKPARCAAIVHVPQNANDETTAAIAQLRELSTLVNVAKIKKAVEALKNSEIPLNGYHGQT